jgi:hypothetical protein
MKKHRHVDQWSKIENPEVNLSAYGQAMFYYDIKSTENGEGTILSTNVAEETGYQCSEE